MDTEKPDWVPKSASREALSLALRTLAAKTPHPESADAPGAMCYSPRPLNETMVHHCPICGEKSIHGLPTIDVVRRLEILRRLVKVIPIVEVELDERRLCPYCTPDTSARSLGLVIHIDTPTGPISKRTWNARFDDVELLIDFLTGSNSMLDEPFRGRLQRLGTLLGLPVV